MLTSCLFFILYDNYPHDIAKSNNQFTQPFHDLRFFHERCETLWTPPPSPSPTTPTNAQTNHQERSHMASFAIWSMVWTYIYSISSTTITWLRNYDSFLNYSYLVLNQTGKGWKCCVLKENSLFRSELFFRLLSKLWVLLVLSILNGMKYKWRFCSLE